MKKILISTLFFIIFSQTHLAIAANKTVTINWTISDSTQDVQSYSMLYSYNSNMADALVACTTNEQAATTLSCENIELNETTVYFRIDALLTSQEIVKSNIQPVIISSSVPSIVQGFTLVASGNSEPTVDIFDDFSTDTAANYSFISGSMYIENGQAHGQSWRRTIGYHTTTLGKADQAVSATCSFTDGDYSSVAARIDPSSQTGYYASIRSGDLTLHSFSGSSSSWIAETSHSFTSPVKLELIVTGDNIVVKINDIVQINTTSTKYSSGNFCGPVINRNMTNADITIDNFKGTAQ